MTKSNFRLFLQGETTGKKSDGDSHDNHDGHCQCGLNPKLADQQPKDGRSHKILAYINKRKSEKAVQQNSPPEHKEYVHEIRIHHADTIRKSVSVKIRQKRKQQQKHHVSDQCVAYTNQQEAKEFAVDAFFYEYFHRLQIDTRQ